jgi:hypothetical protein
MSAIPLFEGQYPEKPRMSVSARQLEANQLWTEIDWQRKGPKFMFDETDFTKPRNVMIIGGQDTGKGALGESIGEGHLEYGNCFIDLWGATDSEGLGWLKSKYAIKNPEKVLLVHDPNVELQFEKKVYDTKSITQVDRKELEDYRLILTTPRFFDLLNWEARYAEIARFIQRLWVHRQGYHHLINVLCREASEILYSRLTMYETQIETKSRTIYMLQECRHSGVCWTIDTLRPMNIDAAVREGVIAYTIFKALDYRGLPDDLAFMYRFYKPEAFTWMRPEQFIVLTRTGGVGDGLNHLPDFHKVETQNLEEELGIHVEFKKELAREGKTIAGRAGVGDVEHAAIIRTRIQQHLSTRRIAVAVQNELAMERPRQHYTITEQMDGHNRAVINGGKCAMCERAESKFAEVQVE